MNRPHSYHLAPCNWYQVAAHSGVPTRAEGDMSYVDEPFDPRPISEPRRRMPGVLDLDVENNQLNMVNFTAVVNRTANVAVLNQALEV